MGHITRVLLALLTTAAWADAQPVADQFSRLNDFLRLGDTVILTDLSGQDIRGTLQALQPETMELMVAGKPRTISGRDVSIVQLRKADSLVNGTLIGAAIGTGLGAAWGAAYDDNWVNTVGLLGIICGAVGTGLGAAIDSAIPTRVVVYRRPRGAGIAMSMKF